MAVLKLSQITASGSNLVAADTLVGVHSGTTDLLFSGTQVASLMWASPTFTGTVTLPDTSTVTASAITLNSPVAVVSTNFGLSGNVSAPAWTTNGVRYKNVAATLTDTSSSGTVATAYTDVWGGNTIAASSAATFTNYYGAYFKAPVAGTNVTFTNGYALGADSLSVNGNIVSSGQVTTSFNNIAAGAFNVASNTTQLMSINNTAFFTRPAITTLAMAQASFWQEFDIYANNVKTLAVTTGGVTITPIANSLGLTVTGGSITGSSIVAPGISVTGTINTSGVVIGAGLNIAITDTAHGSNSTIVSILGGSAGATNLFKIDTSGTFTTPGDANIRNAFISGTLEMNTGSTSVTSPSAATLQLGAADAAAPVAQTLQAQSVVAGNANTAGATLTIAGSKSNGSGSADVVFQTTLSNAASGTQNTLAQALRLFGGGQSAAVGSASIATNSTDGFIYIPAAAGTPSGTPTSHAGFVPMYLDTTTSQLWLYMGGAWKQPKTPAGAATVTWQ